MQGNKTLAPIMDPPQIFGGWFNLNLNFETQLCWTTLHRPRAQNWNKPKTLLLVQSSKSKLSHFQQKVGILLSTFETHENFYIKKLCVIQKEGKEKRKEQRDLTEVDEVTNPIINNQDLERLRISLLGQGISSVKLKGGEEVWRRRREWEKERGRED